jgi:hypothetical protein
VGSGEDIDTKANRRVSMNLDNFQDGLKRVRAPFGYSPGKDKIGVGNIKVEHPEFETVVHVERDLDAIVAATRRSDVPFVLASRRLQEIQPGRRLHQLTSEQD